VVLPEAGNPQTMINLGPVADLSINRLSLMDGLQCREFSRRKMTDFKLTHYRATT